MGAIKQAMIAAQPGYDEIARNALAHRVAQEFHESYERRAPDFGYRTREASAKPWADVPAQNKSLMVAVVDELIERGFIADPTDQVGDQR